jgi:hypothetical protein
MFPMMTAVNLRPIECVAVPVPARWRGSSGSQPEGGPTVARSRIPAMVHGVYPELDPASVACQRWNDREHTWVRRRDGGFNRDLYTVEPIPDDTTPKRYIEQNHYEGSYVNARWRYGMYLHTTAGTELVGVAVFSIPANTRVLTKAFPTLAPFDASIELGRLVLDGGTTVDPGTGATLLKAPSNSETWFLGQCFDRLAGDGVEGVVSFADPVPRQVGDRLTFAGHRGVIYQAKNAHYDGRSSPQTIVLLPNGQSLSNRSMGKIRRQESGHEYVERRLIELGARVLRAGEDPRDWMYEALEDIGARRFRHRGKIRYLFGTGRRARKRLGLHPNPYAYVRETDPVPASQMIVARRRDFAPAA